jgi:hypothetical protein
MNVDPIIRQRARELLRNLTPAEKILWRALRDRRFANSKFRRQFPIGPYIPGLPRCRNGSFPAIFAFSRSLATDFAPEVCWKLLKNDRFGTLEALALISSISIVLGLASLWRLTARLT